MKNFAFARLTLASLALAALAACGGGGGGGGEAPAAGGGTGGAGGDVPPVVAPVTPPKEPDAPSGGTDPVVVPPTIAPYVAPAAATVADCPRFLTAAAAESAIDLSDAKVKAQYDYLKALDPNGAYQTFIRFPQQYMAWYNTYAGSWDAIQSHGTSNHETLHAIDQQLTTNCPASVPETNNNSYLLQGTLYRTDLKTGVTETPTYSSTVDAELPVALKSGLRYNTYIAGGVNAGNGLGQLLDELNAYTNSAMLENKILAGGSPASSTAVGYDADLGGTVDFMIYLQSYLKSARLNAPAAYAAIQGKTALIAYINAVWAQAEQALDDGYPYTVISGSTASRRLIVSKAALQEIYSAGMLSELDALGIGHKPAAYFNTTYLH
ncbi:hypothetical protein ACSFA0_22435 [Variovorax sp. LT1P1]|uniref:hypothetical protein n=1 Tax=Variovorax sp. LT1P1 TaxID=3443730 RepID=UPI003F460300